LRGATPVAWLTPPFASQAFRCNRNLNLNLCGNRRTW